MRLDRALVARGLVRSRDRAAELVTDGLVTVDGRVVRKPSTEVPDSARLAAAVDPYVSRAAHKLAGALDDSATPIGRRVLCAT